MPKTNLRTSVTERGLGSINDKLNRRLECRYNNDYVHSQNVVFAIDHALRRLASWAYPFTFPLFFLLYAQAQAPP